MELKKDLWKEIVETRKSLVTIYIIQSLLKGDIGHLVSRNELTRLLESKVSKVKIVADDQFKRVSTAYTRDREELKIISTMQKGFQQKLRNIEKFEDMSLNKMKNNYIDSVMKKQQKTEEHLETKALLSSININKETEKNTNLRNYTTLVSY